jgi:hypothetical protein
MHDFAELSAPMSSECFAVSDQEAGHRFATGGGRGRDRLLG